MRRKDGTTFLYHAQGTALGGVLRRPFSYVIESQAATSLSISGGYGSARASNYRFQEVVSFREAYTQVSGSQNPEDGSYNTLVSTTIEGLNIDQMVTAERVVARLVTKHDLKDMETRVVPTGTEFVDLRIAGYPINPELDIETFCTYDTFEKFQNQCKDKKFREEMRSRVQPEIGKESPEFLQKRYKLQTEAKFPPESK